MIILLTAIAVLVTGVPLAAAALVTLASRHEDHARSIADRAPGALAGAARTLLGFRATGITRPPDRPVAISRGSQAWLAGERTGGLDPIGGPAWERTDGLDPIGGPAWERTDGLDPIGGPAWERTDGLDPIGGPALAGGSLPLR